MIAAVQHTRMDRANEVAAAAAARAKALEAILPSLGAFLGSTGTAVSQVASATEATECGDGFDTLAEKIAKDGPIPYTDLRMGLHFDRPVEVWLDCTAGLAVSPVPVESRFLFLFEPEAITKLRAKVLPRAAEFRRVFTHDPEILAALPNATLFPHGGSWILPSAIAAHCEALEASEGISNSVGGGGGPRSAAESWAQRPKRFAVSFVCGGKRATLGHRLRRRVWDSRSAITAVPLAFFSSGALGISGGGDGVSATVPQAAGAGTGAETEAPPASPPLPPPCPPCPVLPALPAAKLLLFDAMFSLAVENVAQDDYFTEKLLDCFLTRTVPIYWGCPNAAAYFDPEGIVHVGRSSGGVDDGRTEAGAEEKKEEEEDEARAEAALASAIVDALNGLTPEDYHRRSAAIATNYRRALLWINQRERMERAVNAELGPGWGAAAGASSGGGSGQRGGS